MFLDGEGCGKHHSHEALLHHLLPLPTHWFDQHPVFPNLVDPEVQLLKQVLSKMVE